MLEFFRRYQRSLFIVITVVIVISFSFFGTFQTFVGNEREDKVAFTAVDGTKVMRSELNDLINFLATDAHDHLFSGVAWAGNGLNDGVIARDILESGLARIVAAPYLPTLGQEMQPRLEREKRYTPYQHPQAPFLTAEQIWTFYAPDVKTNFDRLRSFDNAKTPDAFSARVSLFVAEQQFPSAYLKQLLHYQESMHKWLPPDSNLASRDLALFGYHNVQDWFGRRFLELSAQFIINAAKIAEQKGYQVSKEEILGSLFRNAETSFKENGGQAHLGVATAGDYFQEQLRRLGMDQSRVLKAWSSVLLFRRLFFENADSVLVDTQAYQDFYHHLNEFVDVDLYQLPNEFRFTSPNDLEEFVIYLNAVRAPQTDSKQALTNLSMSLALPKEFLPPNEVKKIYPELVERKFLVRWAGLNKEQLQTKIGVKNTWEWQVADKNWAKLEEKFPELAKRAAKTADSRLFVLDHIDAPSRGVIDSFSRLQIINEHPEWIAQALDEMSLKEEEIALRELGGHVPFDGITNTHQLMQLFDKVYLNDQSPELSAYSQDTLFYYRIQVLERSKPEEVLSFKEAKADGTMDALLDKVLESTYVRLRAKEPARFLNDKGEFKPLSEVRDEIAKSHFEALQKSLDAQVESVKQEMPDLIDWADHEKACLFVALLPHVKTAALCVQNTPDQADRLIRDQSQEDDDDLSEEAKGADQWKLIKSRERITRLGDQAVIDPNLASVTTVGETSPIVSSQNRSLCFFTVVKKGFLPSQDLIREKVLDERDLLSREALCSLGRILLSEMREKGAIVLDKEEESTEEPAKDTRATETTELSVKQTG